MAQLPPIVPFPSALVREKIPLELWISCIDVWRSLLNAHLLLSIKDFRTSITPSSSLLPFLESFLDQTADGSNDPKLKQAQVLRHSVYLVARRALLEGDPVPNRLLHWSFLANLCTVFRGNEDLSTVIREAWLRNAPALNDSVNAYKHELVAPLDSGKPNAIDIQKLHRLVQFGRLHLPALRTIVVGSNFVDSVASAYSTMTQDLQTSFVVLLYQCLTGLVHGTEPNISLFVDHMYSLKTSNTKEKPSLIIDLISNTPLLSKAERHILGSDQSQSRARDLLADLHKLRQPSVHRTKRRRPRKTTAMGHGKDDGHGHVANTDGMHVHRLSLVTQIQDLFPHLGMAFITRLLDEYDNDVETVTAHLLDGSLPPHLQQAHETEKAQDEPTTKNHDHIQDLAPHPTPSPPPLQEPKPAHEPTRRNIFDNDAFDRLAVSTSQIHIGGRRQHDHTLNTDNTNPTQHSKTKAAILSALAAFDADDDERDDTYDLADVGGSVDTTRPGGGVAEADAEASTSTSGQKQDQNEETLFHVYRSSPDAFARDTTTRRSQPRQALKREMGMTDEAIEGWGLMLAREPRRLRALEARYATFGGSHTQNHLPGTAWRAGHEGSGTEDEEVSGAEGPASVRGGFAGRAGRGRGRGRGGGRGGGHTADVASASGDKGTQIARERKEAGKSSRANHNRRAQRAKKMARGGFAG